MANPIRSSRQAAGVVTLIVACLVLCGWIRSRNIDEYFRFRSFGKTIHEIHSCHRGLAWITVHEGDTGLTPMEDGEPETLILREGYRQSHSSASNKPTNSRSSPVPYVRYSELRWNWCGVCWETNSPDKIVSGKFSMLLIPYSFLVIPLTLAAAWLLFNKTRAKTTPAQV